MTRHADWAAFQRVRLEQDGGPGRLVLFTTKGATPLNEFVFRPDDVLLFGSEPSGAPDYVHAAADARVVIPIQPGARSLNLSVSAGIAVYEAQRQSSLLPLGEGGP
jgi:tRNA (cytidine/uridine-2'-O-)-methyltransferase